MIVDPGARTRALYRWEDVDLGRRPGNLPLEIGEARRLALEVWRAERWHDKRPCPQITLPGACYAGPPYCLGRSKIVLTPAQRGPVVLMHEIAHARGFGQGRSTHPPGHVLVYLRLLVRYLGWDAEELEFHAVAHGLLRAGHLETFCRQR